MSKILKKGTLEQLEEHIKTISDQEKALLLCEAIQKRCSTQVLKLLINNLQEFNHELKKYKTILHCYCINGKESEILELLLKKGADPNIIINKITPLFVLLNANPNLEFLKIMLKYKADPNCLQKYKLFDAYITKKHIRFDLIKVFIEGGIDVNYSKEGTTALNIIIKKNKENFEIIKMFIDAGYIFKDVDHDSYYRSADAFENYCKRKVIDIEYFKVLLKYYQRDKTEGSRSNPLGNIIRFSGNIEIIKLLIDNGEDPNKHTINRFSNLGMLIGKCFPLDLIKYAIEKGGKLVDTNEKNAFHPVIFSCHNHKDLKYLKYLISIGADLNVKNSLKVSFLEKLCQTHKPNLQMIEYLLENNADINYYCISRGSKPPLFMLSIHETPIELIQKFISKGAKITFEIRNLSITLLENICQKDNVSIQLLNYCYSLFKNHKSLELILQKSAFNLVQHKDNINALKELIKLGFNPHSKNGRNFNLLYSHLLGNSHNLDFIKFLVEEIKIPINDYCDQTYEKTSLEMAVIRRLPIETIIYLLSKGGDPNVKMSNEYYFGTNEDKNQIFLSEKILRWYFSYRFNDVLTKSNSENALIDIYTRLFDALIDSGFNINKPSTENYKHFLSYCGYIIGTKKSKGIFEHILDRGLNPWTIIDKGKNLFANECFSYKRSKKKAANYFSMVLDFYELFKRKENTDFIITSNEDEKIPCHSLILKMRLVNDKIDLERICNVLQNEKKSQIVDFLYWVYCGYVPRPDEDVEKLNLNLALKIGFTKELFYQKNGRNGLLKDLKQFYQNKKSMDFIITVHIENDDDEDSNDEKEIEKEIENENRVTQEKVEEEKIVEIPVHKLILQARSELYRGLFYNLSEQKKVSDYTGKSPLAIQILIEYFYTESVSKEFDEDTLLELFDAVEYYQLSESSSLHYHINKANEYQNQK